jgi:16S rRNA (cytidine1402-2'-O)-methyltransferase
VLTERATGTLYLIPVPLGSVRPDACLPPDTLAVARRLEHFVVERAKTARAHLKAMAHPQPLQALHIEELNEHTPSAAIAPLLAPLKAGHDLGLLSTPAPHWCWRHTVQTSRSCP